MFWRGDSPWVIVKKKLKLSPELIFLIKEFDPHNFSRWIQLSSLNLKIHINMLLQKSLEKKMLFKGPLRPLPVL